MAHKEPPSDSERMVLDWMDASRKTLDRLPHQERLAAVCGLYVEIALDSSVQGAGVPCAERRELKANLGKHVIRATTEFFEAHESGKR